MKTRCLRNDATIFFAFSGFNSYAVAVAETVGRLIQFEKATTNAQQSTAQSVQVNRAISTMFIHFLGIFRQMYELSIK